MMLVSWEAIKSLVASSGGVWRCVEDEATLYVFVVQNGINLGCRIDKHLEAESLADFNDNYRALASLPIVPTDNEGASLIRPKTTRVGWHYQPRYLTWTTALYASLHNKQADASTDCGDAELKFWNANGTELKRSDYASDELFQTALTEGCTRTAMDWHSAVDFDIRGARFISGVRPTAPTWGYVIAAPDIPAIYGGSVPFLDGGFPLHLMADYTSLLFDAVTVKSIQADPVNKSNKFRLLIDHGLGAQNTMSMGFQTFKE
jgi:hypothetical protein